MKNILFILMFFARLVFGQSDVLLQPYGQDYKILDGPKTTIFNSIYSYSIQYQVYKHTISEIKQYYHNLLIKAGYVKDDDRILTQNKKQYTYLGYMSDDYKVTICLNAVKGQGVEVSLTKTQNKILFKDSGLDINNKQDNKGFDLKDVPRTRDSIRVTSLLNCNQKEGDLCNIIYKSELSLLDLSQFYFENMKKYQWKPSYSHEFFHAKEGYWMIFNKPNRKCLISIMYLKEFKSNIVSIYYSLKKE